MLTGYWYRLFCFVEDIDLYTEDRYRVAREVTHAVMNALEEFDDETRLRYVLICI